MTRSGYGASAAHTCHAEGCDVHVPRSMLMCGPHWRMVPKSLRNAIWEAFVPGQERRMDPSAEYLEVTQRAIALVARKERLIP